MSKHFNMQDIEEELDYYLALNNDGNELINDLFNLIDKNAEQILRLFKNTIIIWATYKKISNEEENYELSAKIMKLIEIERNNTFDSLIQINFPKKNILKYLNSIIEEIEDIVN
jgi:hypothetical protein